MWCVSIGGKRRHVFDGEVFDRRLHQRAGESGARAVLEIVELADEIGRRATGNAGDRANSFQFGAVTDRALHGLAGAARRRQLATFRDGAGRDVGYKARP